MKVLFVAHHPFNRTRTRTEHIVARLSRSMEVHVVNFSVEPVWRDLQRFERAFSPASVSELGVKVHEVLRFPKLRKLNGVLLTRKVRQIVQDHQIDAVVISPNQYMVGSLRVDQVGVPVICDYLDGLDWSEVNRYPRPVADESEYVQRSAAVICVSRFLQSQARRTNDSCFYVPNGVEVNRYREFALATSVSQAKAKIGLDPESLVVSIIGLTCSPSLYFIDAVKQLHDRGRRIQLMLVGSGGIREQIRQRSHGYEHVIRDFGPIPYNEILTYFAAADIGLYTVDDSSYYHAASPLKVFEYAAMGKPVIIAPALRELQEVGLSNFIYCENSAQGLARAIEETESTHSSHSSDLRINEFDWSRLAEEFGRILASVANRNAFSAREDAQEVSVK